MVEFVAALILAVIAMIVAGVLYAVVWLFVGILTLLVYVLPILLTIAIFCIVGGALFAACALIFYGIRGLLGKNDG